MEGMPQTGEGEAAPAANEGRKSTGGGFDPKARAEAIKRRKSSALTPDLAPPA